MRALLPLGVVLCLWLSPLAAATLRVPDDYATIQAAIDAASIGDTVEVGPGVYEIDSPIVFRGKGVRLVSTAGAEATTVRMGAPANGARASVFAFEESEPPEAEIVGLTISGGRGIMLDPDPPDVRDGSYPVGGGVYIGPHAAPRFTDCRIENNSAALGGGMFCDVDSQPVLVRNVFRGNHAEVETLPGEFQPGDGGGLAALADAVVGVQDGSFEDNTAQSGGAVRGFEGAVIGVVDVRFSANEASWSGGAIFFMWGSLAARECTFSGNVSSVDGGAIAARLVALPDQLVVESCRFENNQAGTGGGVWVDTFPRAAAAEKARILDCEFVANRAHREGGGVSFDYQASDVLIESCRFRANRADRGGGLDLGYESRLTVRDCVVTENVADEGGGASGFFSYSVLDRCTIVGNSAGVAGGIGGSFATLDVGRTIVWGNAGENVLLAWTSDATVIHDSCIEGGWDGVGEGNVDADPRFAGWGDRGEVYVDAAREEPGDGTIASPFRELAEAVTGFALGLAPDSPCLHAGPEGERIGADTGLAGAAGAEARRIHVLPGTYELAELQLAPRSSVIGGSPESTVLEGTVWGLRTGAVVEGVTVTRGLENGGMVVGASERPEIRDCAIRGNDRGIRCKDGSAPIIIRCSFTGNRSESRGPPIGWRGSAGAAIRCGYYSSPTLIGCQIIGNWGGAIRLRDWASVHLSSCVIAGNVGHPDLAENGQGTASVVDFREGIDAPPVTIEMVNCTFFGNANDSPLLRCEDRAQYEIVNCLFWQDEVGETCAAPVELGNLTGVDPLLERAGEFDFTRTVVVEENSQVHTMPDFIVDPGSYRLRAGSPAIDAGVIDGAPGIDLDGRPRPCGAGVDVGAYEAGDCEAAAFRRGDPNGDAETNLSDAVFVLEYLFSGGRAPGCLDGSDVNDSGTVNISDPIYLLSFLFSGGPSLEPPADECGIDSTADLLGCGSDPRCP